MLVGDILQVVFTCTTWKGVQVLARDILQVVFTSSTLERSASVSKGCSAERTARRWGLVQMAATFLNRPLQKMHNGSCHHGFIVSMIQGLHFARRYHKKNLSCRFSFILFFIHHLCTHIHKLPTSESKIVGDKTFTLVNIVPKMAIVLVAVSLALYS